MGIAQELFGLVGGLASGSYPAFVTGNDLGGELPVFMFHKVDPRQMDVDFAALRRNGYSCLDAAEHIAALAEDATRPERSVVLTFDDGLEDLYTEAFPLLRKHGLKAVAFIVPARVGTRGIVTWEQVREMHDSGAVDFQSHSMTHAAIPTAQVIDDFFHPDKTFHGPWDMPVDARWQKGLPVFPPPLGAPIWAHGSRLDDAPRFIPEPSFEARFAEHVKDHGEARFFETRGWRDTLRGLAHAVSSNGSGRPSGRFETAEEQHAAVRAELAGSRERIESEIPGARVRAIAYPWHLYGRVALGLLEECGYDAAYAGLTPNKGGPGSGQGAARFELARLSGDFIPCLPGDGRQSLVRVLGSKIFRRLTTGRPY